MNNTKEDYLFTEQMKLFVSSMPMSLLANIINSIMLVTFLWNGVEQQRLLIWFFSITIVLIYRTTILVLYKKTQLTKNEKIWYFHMFFGATMTGVCWGAAGFFLFPVQGEIYQALLAFVIAGMTAGSVVVLAAFIEVTIIYTVLLSIPFTIRLLLLDSTQGSQMAFMVFLFLIIMISSARRTHQNMLYGMEMKYKYHQAEQKVAQLIYFDELTKLPNRRMLNERLEQSLSRTSRQKTKGAILFLDLDNFKIINDTLGHGTGDRLLVAVANTLSNHLRKEDLVARLGGDEFVILMDGLKGDNNIVNAIITNKAETFMLALNKPFNIDGHQLEVTASIGVSLFPDDSDNPETLLKYADIAMYQSKDGGKNQVHIYQQNNPV
jgi:diguanylate cyclase (GGDEF)-like protein